jgi:hypothetical protein
VAERSTLIVSPTSKTPFDAISSPGAVEKFRSAPLAAFPPTAASTSVNQSAP